MTEPGYPLTYYSDNPPEVTFFVSPLGADTNDGTRLAPLRTVARAIEMAGERSWCVKLAEGVHTIEPERQ